MYVLTGVYYFLKLMIPVVKTWVDFDEGSK